MTRARAHELAQQRQAARAARDFGLADALREQIEQLGFTVRDRPDGFELTPLERPVLAGLAALPDHSADPDDGRATVSVLVDGWPADAVRCVQALLAHLPADVGLQVLDAGNVDGAGDAVDDAVAADPRAQVWHLPAPVGWGEARAALLRADRAEVHVWCELSTIFDGDALSPLLAAFADPAVVAAGWRGADVDRDGWTSFTDAGPGEVDAVLGYLFAMRRRAALSAGGPHPRARFYRNADLEFSLALRVATGGRLVVPPGPLPVHQERHRGYHDSDPAYRDRESRRTYTRLLERFRDRPEALAPRS